MSTLAPAEAGLFFKLMWAVQFYLNRQLKLVPGVKTVEEYQKLPQEDKMKVREALYQQIERLDSFITENPAGFSPEELEIVRGWKGFINGDFYIFKFLKRHTIFSSAELAQAAHSHSANLDELYKLAKRAERALNQVWTALDRAE